LLEQHLDLKEAQAGRQAAQTAQTQTLEVSPLEQVLAEALEQIIILREPAQ
jgi:hypothetical protein